MAPARDLYQILGIERDASDDDIRKAYRRLARELHPDVNAEPRSEEQFKEVAGAYEILERDDVPARVAISEYVDIAHAFFSDEEPKVVNGILDRLGHKARPAEFAKHGTSDG